MSPADNNRNREMTEQRLIAAVGQLLAEQGFQSIGVNAIARTAGGNFSLSCGTTS